MFNEKTITLPLKPYLHYLYVFFVTDLDGSHLNMHILVKKKCTELLYTCSVLQILKAYY